MEIEASGWGTKVTLTAEVVEAPAAEPEVRDALVGEVDVEPEACELDVEPEAVQVEVAPAAVEVEPEAGAPVCEPDPERAEEPIPARSRRERRGLLGRWLSRRRRADSRSDTAAPASVIEPILASAIADGAIEVVERGSGRAERDVPLPEVVRCEPGRGDVA